MSSLSSDLSCVFSESGPCLSRGYNTGIGRWLQDGGHALDGVNRQLEEDGAAALKAAADGAAVEIRTPR